MIGILVIMCGYDSTDHLLEIKEGIEEAFSQEREDKWKARLAELATNPRPIKKSQNSLTSKQLDCLMIV